MKLVTCENCNNEFYKNIAEIKRTNHNFCSKKCSGSFREKLSILSFFDKKEVDDNGCWNWTGSLNKHGYGVKRFKGKPRLTHRIAYKLHYGSNIEGVCVCHKCDNPKCFNPNHLFLGSHQDNMDDMAIKGRKYAVLDRHSVTEIRRSKLKNSDLARIYKVSERTIRYAKNKNTWQPLPNQPEGE